MTVYVLTLDELPAQEDPETHALLRARMHSPDLDYDSSGFTFVKVPRHLIGPDATADDHRLLCASVCATALEETAGTERTDEDIINWLQYLYHDFSNCKPEQTQGEVQLLPLSGQPLFFDWEDRTSIEEMAQTWQAWQRRKVLLQDTGMTRVDSSPRRSHKM